MTNYEALKNLNLENMEFILDSIYLAGLNNGLYVARLEDEEKCDVLENNPFDLEWLQSEAEDAIRYVDAEDRDSYVLDPLAAAILRNAGIPDETAEMISAAAESTKGEKGFSIKIGASVEIRTGAADSDDEELEELEEKLEELLEELEELEEEEPEDEDSDEYEEWEEAVDELKTEIEELEEEIEELRG